MRRGLVFVPVARPIAVEWRDGRPQGHRKPRYVDLRLAHPLGRKASWVQGGTYHAGTETVHIEPFDGRAEVTLGFDAENRGVSR